MAIALVRSNAGNTGATAPSSFDASLGGTPTTGNMLLLVVTSDATVTTPSGWTLDRSQVNNAGHYLYRKTSDGTESTVTVSPTVAAASSWAYLEYSGAHATPLLEVASQGSGFGETTWSTGTTASTTGATDGLAVASWSTSNVSGATNTASGYTNSFVEVADTCSTTSGTNAGAHVATLAPAGDGTFECTATFALSVPATGIMAVYAPAAGDTTHEADGTRAVTATITGEAAVTRNAAGTLTVTAARASAVTMQWAAGGTLAVTANRTGAGAIAELFKTLHQGIGVAPSTQAHMVTAFSPNTASGGWHRGDGAHPIHGTGWSLYCFNDFYVSDGAGGVQGLFRRNSVLMVDHDDGEVWWLSSGDGLGIAGSVTFPWPNGSSWAWLRGGWATGTASCVLLGAIYNSGGTLTSYRVMAVADLTGTSPIYTVTHPCGLDASGTVAWQGTPVVVDGYVYVPGLGDLSHYLARVAVSTDVTTYGAGAWEYWTGAGWSTTFADRAAVTVGNAPLRALSFIEWNGRYLASAKDFDASPESGLSNTDWTELKVWVADAVTGPWVLHGIVYDTEVTDWWSYTARAELLPGMTDLSVIWSINTDISFDADLYGPQIAAPNQVGRADNTATITGTAGFELGAAGTLEATATITGDATATTAAAGTRPVTATLAGTAGLDASAAGTFAATAAIAGTAAVARPVAGDLEVTAGLDGEATSGSDVIGTAAVEATITGAAVAAHPADGTLEATAALAGTAAVARPAAGDVEAAATIAGVGLVVHPVAGTLTVTSTLAGAGDTGLLGDLAATATITGTATTVAAGDGTRPVTVSLAGAAAATGGVAGTQAVTVGLVGAAEVETAATTVTVTAVHGTGPLDDLQTAAGYNPEAGTLTVAGTASSSLTVSRVEVTVDGAAPVVAAGTTAWTLVVDVSGWAAGSHTVSAVAVDSGGGQSTPAEVTVWSSPSRAYGAAATPGGHLVPVTFTAEP